MRVHDQFEHGLNERLPVRSFYNGLRFWELLLQQVAGSQRPGSSGDKP